MMRATCGNLSVLRFVRVSCRGWDGMGRLVIDRFGSRVFSLPLLLAQRFCHRCTRWWTLIGTTGTMNRRRPFSNTSRQVMEGKRRFLFAPWSMRSTTYESDTRPTLSPRVRFLGRLSFLVLNRTYEESGFSGADLSNQAKATLILRTWIGASFCWSFLCMFSEGQRVALIFFFVRLFSCSLFAAFGVL